MNTAPSLTHRSPRCEHKTQGFIAVTQQEVTTTALYQGEHLLAIAKDSYNDIVVLKQAKNIFSAKIQFLLGHKTLKSREIFQACLTT